MSRQIKCPDCKAFIEADQIREHILMCKSYNKILLGTTVRLAETLSCDDLKFLMAELDMAKETILGKLVHFGTYQSAHEDEIGPSSIEHNKSEKPTNTPAEMDLKPKCHEIIKEQERRKEDVQQKQQNVVDLVQCLNCRKQMDANQVNLFSYNYTCLHLLCLECIKSYVRDQYVAKKGKLPCLASNCKSELPPDQIRQVLGRQQFDQLEAEVLRSTMEFARCCKCKHEYQFAEGDFKDAPKTDESGKKIMKLHAVHYAKNRFVCPNERCKQEQCKVCHTAPYHLGRTCSENEEFKNSKKCRYCKNVLKRGYTSNLGLKAFDDICERKECQKIATKACSKIHPCKHPCYGYIKQAKCLPCLTEECSKKVLKHDQDENAYCSICYVEDLKASPCVMSSCGHIFHYSCLEKRLQIRWLTPRILFGFCHCPLCKQWITLPEDCPLTLLVNKNKQLYESLKEKAESRLKFEKLEKDPKLTDPKSNFYNKPSEYAMAIYAYFECFKCKKPYFGGRKSCAEMMGEETNSASADFDASKLVCPQCCPVETKNCTQHGKQFLAFKCKFCCNIGLWFCWGSTHFCDDCHRRQQNGEYISKLAKQKLPKCAGKQKCPSGGDHGENGSQYSLGCMICRNKKTQIHDF